jgi:hypothetical protein
MKDRPLLEKKIYTLLSSGFSWPLKTHMEVIALIAEYLSLEDLLTTTSLSPAFLNASHYFIPKIFQKDHFGFLRAPSGQWVFRNGKYLTDFYPFDISLLQGDAIAKAIAGEEHSFVLAENGRLFICEDNSLLSESVSSLSSKNKPEWKEVKIPEAQGKIVDVSIGGSYNFIRTNSNQWFVCKCILKTFDLNYLDDVEEEMTLASDLPLVTSASWIQVQIPELKESIVELVPGGSYDFAFTESGRLFAGSSEGDNSNQPQWMEIEPPNPGIPMAFVAPDDFGNHFILTADGGLFRLNLNKYVPIPRWTEFNVKDSNSAPVSIAKIIKGSQKRSIALSTSGRLFICGSYEGHKLFKFEDTLLNWAEMIIPGLQRESIADVMITESNMFIITNTGRILSQIIVFPSNLISLKFVDLASHDSTKDTFSINDTLKQMLPELLSSILNTSSKILDLSHLCLGSIDPKLILTSLSEKTGDISEIKLCHNHLNLWQLSQWELFLTQLPEKVRCLDLSGNEFSWATLSLMTKLANERNINIILDKKYGYLQKYYLDQLNSQKILALTNQLNSVIQELKLLRDNSEIKPEDRQKKYQEGVTTAIQLITHYQVLRRGNKFKLNLFQANRSSLWNDLCSILKKPSSQAIQDLQDRQEKIILKIGKATLDLFLELLHLENPCSDEVQYQVKRPKL